MESYDMVLFFSLDWINFLGVLFQIVI